MARAKKNSSQQSASKKAAKTTLADFVSSMNAIAPVRLAQSWDNIGLLAGDPDAPLRCVLLCIDLTHAVVDEAIKAKADLIMAYHPPIFKPIASLRADSTGTDAVVFRCIAKSIAIYSTHTALDAADGGTNDVLASLCGITKTEPLEYIDDPGGVGTTHQSGAMAKSGRVGIAHQSEPTGGMGMSRMGAMAKRSAAMHHGADEPPAHPLQPSTHGAANQFKLVVFIPPNEVEEVTEAMFAAGAGHIGDYSNCSYRLEGQGTFIGGESTNPTVGEKGRMEYVDEVRLETVVPGQVLPAVVSAMIQAHSYEEPAYDIYPLKPKPVRGIGRVGSLPEPITLGTLAKTLTRRTGATCVQIVGEADHEVSRAVIVAGAAGSLPFKLKLTPRDVVITGEIRHHDALAIRRLGCTAIALGHWASERPALESLAARLELSTGADVQLSKADRDPFAVA